MAAVLELRNVTKKYPDRSRDPERTYLFSKVTAEIAEPDRIAVLGVSGQGKTTLLRILASLDVPDEGEIILYGIPSVKMDPRRWRTKVCYAAQQSVMLPGTIEDNLQTVSRLHETPYDRELTRKLLSRLELDDLDLNRKAGDLSGGEKQRISLIRSLLLRPAVLLLDEITASLDQNSKEKVEELLLQWQAEEGCTLIWVTHDLEQARHISQRIWFMGEGTLLEDTPSDIFFHQPESALARSFLQLPAGKESV